MVNRLLILNLVYLFLPRIARSQWCYTTGVILFAPARSTLEEACGRLGFNTEIVKTQCTQPWEDARDANLEASFKPLYSVAGNQLQKSLGDVGMRVQFMEEQLRFLPEAELHHRDC